MAENVSHEAPNDETTYHATTRPAEQETVPAGRKSPAIVLASPFALMTNEMVEKAKQAAILSASGGFELHPNDHANVL